MESRCSGVDIFGMLLALGSRGHMFESTKYMYKVRDVYVSSFLCPADALQLVLPPAMTLVDAWRLEIRPW